MKQRTVTPNLVGSREHILTWQEFSDLFDRLNAPDVEARDLRKFPAVIGSTWAEFVNSDGHNECETWDEVRDGFHKPGTELFMFGACGKANRPDFKFRYAPHTSPPTAALENVQGLISDRVDELQRVFVEAFPISTGRVFISWGKPKAQAVADKLQPMIAGRIAPANAFTSMSMGPLELGLEKMLSELKQTNALIALISKESAASTMQLWEIAAAWAREITVIPILIDDVEHGQLPDPLGNLQSVRISNRKRLDEWLAKALTAAQPNRPYEALTDEEYSNLLQAAAGTAQATNDQFAAAAYDGRKPTEADIPTQTFTRPHPPAEDGPHLDE